MNCNRMVALCVAGLAGATCVLGDACGVSPNPATGAYGSDTVFSPSGVTTKIPPAIRRAVVPTNLQTPVLP